MSIKHLSETRDLKDFFSKLKKGDYFNYHPSYDLEHLRKLGRDHGWLIEYCSPETNAYKKHGHYICRVISKLSRNQRMINPIDSAVIAFGKDFEKKSWVKKKALAAFIK